MKANLPLIVAAAAGVQWLLFAALSAFSRAQLPKKALMRKQEKLLIASSIALLAAWLWAFDAWPLLAGRAQGPTAGASMTGRKQLGSCASLEPGMTEAQVRQKVGLPDEVRPDEEIRGPGASTMLYRGSRCSVHLVDGLVEFVD